MSLINFITQRHRCLVRLGSCHILSLRFAKLHTDVAETDKVDTKNKDVYFKNVKLVTPQILNKYLYHGMKLKFVEEHTSSKEPGIELLRNIAANYDYWIVRGHQDLLLYYRLQMMQQRLSFLKSVGLNPRQKLRQIQKNPPVLLFTFTNATFESKMVYLRGLLYKKDFIHLFYPVTRKLQIAKSNIEHRVQRIEEHLEMKQPAVIRELLNMPCFFMDPTLLEQTQHLFVHKFSMPFNYDIDKQTASILPPVCNLQKLDLSATKHFSNKTNDGVIGELPTYQLDDVLDYSYSLENGRGSSECLSTFLIKAELEEDKDRTGCQPLKGRRGFNVPARQY